MDEGKRGKAGTKEREIKRRKGRKRRRKERIGGKDLSRERKRGELVE